MNKEETTVLILIGILIGVSVCTLLLITAEPVRMDKICIDLTDGEYYDHAQFKSSNSYKYCQNDKGETILLEYAYDYGGINNE